MRPDERPPLAFQLVFLGKHLDHLIEHRLATHGLNRTQLLTLTALMRHEGLNAMALCAHARVEPANVTRTLQSLERSGLIERRPHPTDGRVYLFYLTEAGRAAAEQLSEEMRRLSAQLIAGVDEDELRGLQAGLVAVWKRLHAQMGESDYHRMTNGTGGEQPPREENFDAERR